MEAGSWKNGHGSTRKNTESSDRSVVPGKENRSSSFRPGETGLLLAVVLHWPSRNPARHACLLSYRKPARHSRLLSSRKPAQRAIRDPGQCRPQWQARSWFLDSGSRAPAKAGPLGRNDERWTFRQAFFSWSFRASEARPGIQKPRMTMPLWPLFPWIPDRNCAPTGMRWRLEVTDKRFVLPGKTRVRYGRNISTLPASSFQIPASM